MKSARDMLDELFGPVKEARSSTQSGPNMDWEKDRSPVSLCVLDEESGRAMRLLLEACKRAPFLSIATSFTLIWAIDPDGVVHVAVEELAQFDGEIVNGGFPMRRHFPVRITNEQKLGHPCLLPGLEARAAGELYLDKHDGNLGWFLNFQSGRFHKEPQRRPSEQQALNVLQKFADLIGSRINLDSGGYFA